MKVVSVQEE